MSLFFYKAADKSGKTVKGSLQVKELPDAISSLQGMGLTPVEIKKRSIWNTDLGELSGGGKVNRAELSLFCGQLSFAVGAGVPVSNVFGALYQHSFSSSPRLRTASREVHELLQKGESLSTALDRVKIFPMLLVAMAEVGERSGTLDVVMDRLAEYYEREHKISSEIINSLIYPAMVSIMMLGVVILALVYVLPRYAEMFLADGILLPLPTRLLISAGDFFRGNYIFIIAGLTVLLLACHRLLRTHRGRFFLNGLCLNFPLGSGLYRKILSLRFVQALSIMVDSGMEITPALSAARGVLGNMVLERALDRVIADMRAGENLGASLSRIKYFDGLLSSMIGMAEESGTLTATLRKCAGHLQSETQTTLSRMNKFVEPAVTIVIGVILAFVMMSIMLPTFYMVNTL